MVRITKVYTRGGDGGQTSLVGGERVAKASRRVEAYGTVDELLTFLGSAAEALRDKGDLAALRGQILRLQNELFDLGSRLATPEDKARQSSPAVSAGDVTRLEEEMDAMNEDLPALSSFILPGGGEASARLHLARTVCRRAEREVLRLAQNEDLEEQTVPYLNRLSDWLFVAARHVARLEAVEETLWRPGERE